MAILRPAGLVLLALGLAACGERPGSPPKASPTPSATLPDDGALVLRVEYTGGLVNPETTVGQLPVLSLYGDGRLITEGPVPAIYPGFALPNVRVQQLDPAQVQELADRALAAGMADDGDLGTPPVADARSTRFTLVSGGTTYVREVYALADFAPPPGHQDPSGTGLTDDQQAARAEFTGLLTALFDVGQQGYAEGRPPEDYEPAVLATVARPWTDPADGLEHPEAPWPGPPLPGEPLGGLPGLTCTTVAGEHVRAVLDAARQANQLTPWVSGDGSRWSVLFRPLLPDETGCADLTPR